MKQAELQRALRACRKEGQTVKGVDIEPNGTVRIILHGPNDNEVSEAEALEKRIQNGLGTRACRH